MALKDWKRKRSKNPYVEKIYINDKKKLMLEIYYDIGLENKEMLMFLI